MMSKRSRSLYFALLSILLAAGSVLAGARSSLDGYLGKADAAFLQRADGLVLYARNTEQPLVPASTLKLLTSLLALDTLGPNWRFQTDIYIDARANLIIKGYGDPLLISENILDIAAALWQQLAPEHGVLTDLVLDDTYFQHPLVIPGVTDSFEPYDAPNGALCANFNTVHFRSRGNRYESAETQTPLLSMAMDPIRKSGLKNGRIVISQEDHRHTLYAGQVFRYFLEEKGFRFRGRIRLAKVDPAAKRIYSYRSPNSLDQTVSRLLYYSNNFIANQMLITAGVETFGPPGSLEKGVQAARRYAEEKLGLRTLEIEEGSGISRGNRISASDLMQVAAAFEAHRSLLRKNGRESYKTGTLRGVSTRVGYIEAGDEIYRYVIMLNTPGKSAERVKDQFMILLDEPAVEDRRR